MVEIHLQNPLLTLQSLYCEVVISIEMDHLFRTVEILKKMADGMIFIFSFFFEVGDGGGRGLAVGESNIIDFLHESPDTVIQELILFFQLNDLACDLRFFSPHGRRFDTLG